MDAQTIDVSRILFGFAAAFHYLFVPLTIGLAALIAILDAFALATRRFEYTRAADYWTRLLLINFVCGLLTGWPLRLLIEQQWTRYSQAVGEVFGWVFALEGRIAPFLFTLALAMVFRHRLPAALRLLVSALLAAIMVAQSSAILMLNAWMQNPVGVEVLDGHFRLTDPGALLANPLALPKILHTVGAAYVLGGVFVLAVSALCLLKDRHTDIARASLRTAACFTLVALGVTGLAGHLSGLRMAQWQPAKFAAVEALWEPERESAAFTAFAIPDEHGHANRHAVQIPHVLGWITEQDESVALPNRRDVIRQTEAQLSAALDRPRPAPAVALPIERYQREVGVLSLLRVPPEDATPADIAAAAQRAMPSVTPLFWAFRSMVAAFVVLTALVVWVAWRQPDAARRADRRLLWACVAALPLPWIATEAGWLLCEMGRQPWTVAGALATQHSVGDMPAGRSALALLSWGALYAALLVVNVVLSTRWIRLGPDGMARRRFVSAREKRRILSAARRGERPLEDLARRYRVTTGRVQRWLCDYHVARLARSNRPQP